MASLTPQTNTNVPKPSATAVNCENRCSSTSRQNHVRWNLEAGIKGMLNNYSAAVGSLGWKKNHVPVTPIQACL